MAGCAETPSPDDAGGGASADSRCKAVPRQLVRDIETSLTVDGVRLRDARAVRSKDYKRVYFVAARLEGAGFAKGDIAVWSTNSLKARESVRTIMAADNYAEEFSDLGADVPADKRPRFTADGGQEAQGCVRERT